MRRLALSVAAVVLFVGVLAVPAAGIAARELSDCKRHRFVTAESWRARAVDDAGCRTWERFTKRRPAGRATSPEPLPPGSGSPSPRSVRRV
ncbi:hypothetical protein Lfu02_18510 [Longispora fulva]|nr:hypothetical protein Lfu02_18510 [Longispora fulva]